MIILLLSAVILIIAQSCSSASYSTEDIRLRKINMSNNYKDGIFFNKNGSLDMNFFKMLPLLWDFLFTRNERKPDVTLPVKQVDFNPINNANPYELKVTWIGHSSEIINIDGKIILTDPVYSNKTVFLGPRRYNGNVPLNINELPEIDLVLISHNHYDHLNSPTIEKIHTKVKHFIVPLMVGAELENMGVPRDKIIELDWWDEIILFEDFIVAFTPAQHFSGRGLFDRDKTLWGSFVVKGPKHKIFFSGDSGYFEGFKQIGDKYGPFDLTFLECGAYNERWYLVHMFPEETAQVHIDLKGKILRQFTWALLTFHFIHGMTQW